MPEFVRRDVSEDDEEVVKCAHGTDPISEYPCLGSGSKPERFSGGMKTLGHRLRNEFQYKYRRFAAVITGPRLIGLSFVAIAGLPDQCDPGFIKDASRFDLGFARNVIGYSSVVIQLNCNLRIDAPRERPQ
jgi:hypothetical protein